MKNDSRADAPDPSDDPQDAPAEPAPPACVLSFNANDPSGAGGLAGDVATITAMGGHPLTVVTAILTLDEEAVVEQARTILEDITISGWKVGFLGSADTVAAVAEVLSDYPDVPLVAYVPDLSWLDEDQLQPYQDAYRELILPATEVLVGNLKTLTDLLLPDWDSERPASARELAVAAGDRGTRYVLVTGIALPARGSTPYVDNVLASPQGAITGEKFERFDTAFVGSGETLSAALASLLAAGSELQAAVGEALAFLDQSLDAGFRPGMGGVVPDRFFWALPAAGEGEEAEEPGGLPGEPDEDQEPATRAQEQETKRRVH